MTDPAAPRPRDEIERDLALIVAALPEVHLAATARVLKDVRPLLAALDTAEHEAHWTKAWAKLSDERVAHIAECVRGSRFEELWQEAEAERDTALAREQALREATADDAVLNELRELWQRALEREGNLASAVADVVWKATQFGETDDGDTAAYLVPKGAMHRLVGVAQSNGARVPVAFRAALAGSGVADDQRQEQAK